MLEHNFASFARWHRSGIGYFSWSALHYVVSLIAAAFFARTETLDSFWKGFGLDRKPSEYLWWGIICALAIRFSGHFVLIHGWSKGVSNYEINAFRTALGAERYFFLMPLLLLAPLFEESIYRGFVYKAFRGSYSLAVSVMLIIVWTANSHWQQYSISWIAAFELSLLTVVQCYLREKTDSLWDCILCHAVFNGSSLFV